VDGFGLDRVDIELFLDFCTPFLGLHQPVAKRRHRSVPKSLARVFLHRPDYMLGILFGLILVEQGDDLPHHGLHRFTFVADRLRNRDHSNVMFRKLAEVELLLKGLAKESTVAMDNNVVECLSAFTSAFDHLLENRSAIVAGGSPSLDKFRGYSVSVDATPSSHWVF
jgi:hypothetical protein